LVGSSDFPSSYSFPGSVIGSDQTDSTGKPASDVVENFGAAIRKLEDVFVRITMEGASRQWISNSTTKRAGLTQ
jgi:hypothetical protein